MIAVLTGDIVDSTHQDKARWLPALKSVLENWGSEAKDWEVYRGDEFQLRLKNPEQSLEAAFSIKARLKAVADTDIRIAIGLGGHEAPNEHSRDNTRDNTRENNGDNKEQEIANDSAKQQAATPLTESSGPAFIHSGRKLDEIKKQRIHMAIATEDEMLDRQWNLLLQWVLLSADNWSSVSAEIVDLALTHPGLSQTDMATRLNVQQSAISQRLKRADFDLLWQTLKFFKDKIQSLCR